MSSFEENRKLMVRYQIQARGVKDLAVLKAMESVPREKFIPDPLKSQAYKDHPLPIGFEQTISQPYMVAFMIETGMSKSNQRVLEIGTGSGYQAAVLSHLFQEVYTIEIVEPLAKDAKKVFKDLQIKNIHQKIGDGYEGWKEKSPFDSILVTAACEFIPQPLIDQLSESGHLIIPIGKPGDVQELTQIRKTKQGIERKFLSFVRFVPFTR